MKKIVFTFGRFNPPTTGHQLLANKVKDIAQKRAADYKIFGSSSQDAKRNPLSPTDKFRFMKKILKGFNVAVDRNNKTPFQVLQQLSDEGYEDVTMVVGSDRVQEFKKNMSRYIGKKGYENISKFNVVSAGDRDPDAEGVTGMSASKMRAAAGDGNFDAFRLGMPSHVSERDAMGLFKAIRKGMGIRGKISESASWFDYDEFSEFVNDMEEPQELSEALTLQARRKLSMRMKKTAKKRARIRKMREKRRKTKTQLVSKATKQAIKKIRKRFHKGRAWNDVSYMERIRIGEKMKKKKKAVQRISKRLIPAMHKAEKERLQKVRNRMTSKEPAKAIAPTNEQMDMMFEEYIEEIMSSKMSKAVAQQTARDRESSQQNRARNRGQDRKQQDAARKRDERAEGGGKESWMDSKDPWDHVLVVERGDKKMLITKDDYRADDTLLMGSIGNEKKGKVSKGKAGPLSQDADFKSTPTYRKLVGFEEKQREKKQKQQDPQAAQAPEQEVDPKLAKATQDQQIAQADLNTAQAQQQLADMETQQQQQKDAEETSLLQTFATGIAKLLGIQNTKAPPKKRKEKDSTFDDWDHKAVDMEAGVVAVASGCHMKKSQKSVMDCMKKSGIAEKDIKRIAGSKTLLASSQRLFDRVQEQIPEGFKLEHTGTGLGEVTLSDTYLGEGASNTTPKTDLRAINPETGEAINLSMKIGPGQLMSGQKGEAAATLQIAINRMKGCQGFNTKTGRGENCRNMVHGSKKFIERVDKLKKKIQSDFTSSRLASGMGPTSWWIQDKNGRPGTIGGSKPNWWENSGPGRLGVTWEEAQGKRPQDHPEWFPEQSPDMVQRIEKANQSNKEIMEELESLFNEGEFGRELKEHVMYEAMTGCGKYCPDCCGTEVCAECDAPSMATHMITGNKDGTQGSITKIEPPGSEFMRKMGEKTNIQVRFKTGSQSKTVGGWLKDSGVITDPEAKGYDEKALNKQLEYVGLDIKGKKWSKLSEKVRNDYLSRSKKLGGYAYNTVFGMGASSFSEGVQTFLEFNGDEENTIEKAMEWAGDDPYKLAEFYGLEPEIDTPHENLADMFDSNKESGKATTIVVNGVPKSIPVEKTDDYRDYQKEYEEGEGLDESFRMLTEPDILDRLVTQLKDKGMDNDKAHAVARSQLQKHGVLKKGTDDLTAHGEKRNAMGAAGRAKDRAAKKDGKSPKDYNYNPRTNIATQKEDCGCMNEDVQLDEDNTSAVAKQVKQAVKKHVTGKLVVRSKGGKTRFIMVRADKIDNKLRKKVLDVVAPNANVRDKNNISYGNITNNIISAGVDQWVKALGLNESVEINECWDTHVQRGYKMKGGKRVPNCVPKGSAIKFGESTTHGIGTFANTDIKEGTSLGLYLLDLMEDTPTYQRTDFCRFTNHSHKNANLTLEQVDGSFHATVNRDIQEGEELFIDYFGVFGEIGGADVNIIEEVLRWTKGYENLFIPEDSIDSFVLELSYFVRMGDCPELSEDFLMMLPDYPHQEQQHDKDFFDKTLGREKWQPGDPPKPVGLNQIKEDEDPVKRAKRLKAYNAKPEQRARRSARTNERNKRIRNGQLAVGDGKDIDHKDGNPMNNSASNISITSQKYNRGRNNNKGRTNEEHGAGEMGTKELLQKYLKDTPHMTIDSLFKKEMK